MAKLKVLLKNGVVLDDLKNEGSSKIPKKQNR
jgi:hypothetical protein